MNTEKDIEADDNYLLIEKEIVVFNDILIRLIDLPINTSNPQQSAILDKLRTTELNIKLFLQFLSIKHNISTN